MKVFISWSKERSRVAAEALRTWLPRVLQEVEPWMSTNDIVAGSRWATEIGTQLSQTDFGIICVTPENAEAPWINFEAGALAKSLTDSRVIPYLIGMANAAELPAGPLGQFQSKVATTESFDVVAAINAQLARPLPESALRDQFEMWWPKLEDELNAIPTKPPTKVARPDQNDMLQEILGTVRDIARTNLQARPMSAASAARYGLAMQAMAIVNEDPRIQELGTKIVEVDPSPTSWTVLVSTSSGTVEAIKTEYVGGLRTAKNIAESIIESILEFEMAFRSRVAHELRGRDRSGGE